MSLPPPPFWFWDHKYGQSFLLDWTHLYSFVLPHFLKYGEEEAGDMPYFHCDLEIKREFNRLYLIVSSLIQFYYTPFEKNRAKGVRNMQLRSPSLFYVRGSKIGSIVCTSFVLHCTHLHSFVPSALFEILWGGGYWYATPASLWFRDRKWLSRVRLVCPLYPPSFIYSFVLPPLFEIR